MVLQRNAEGLIDNLGVDEEKDPIFEDAELGDSRRAYLKFVQAGNKLDEMIKLIERSNNPVRNLETTLDEELLYQEHDPSNDHNLGCPNAKDRAGMWVQVQTFGARAIDPDAPFLNRLAYLCRDAGVRPCGYGPCLKNKNDIESLLPKCEWPKFREWAVVLASCHATFAPRERVTRAYFHLFAAIDGCQSILAEYLREGKQVALTGVLAGKDGQTTIDIFGVCEIIYWLLTILDPQINPSFDGRWGPDFLPAHVTAPAIAKAIEEAKGLGLCPSRFWNLAGVTERKQLDLPGLMETAIDHPQLQHAKHDKCTTGFCTFTTLDSTKMDQLHKCSNKECLKKGQFWFDPKLLNESILENGRTVWSSSEPFEVCQMGDYVAISHVWSDGTGIGLQPVGKVNRCLFNFFADIIREEGYSRIWWDTISIPTNADARRKAINDMHNNYLNASATLLHDSYLVNFPWAEDGSPCLALVLSTWLTRGWTALELIMSKKVLVLYKGEDGNPIVKNLDTQILAKDPNRCTRAHWIASTIIHRLRKRDINNVSNLMAILKSRTTSWERDRMIIAGLLAGLDDIPSNIQQDEVTKKIIDRIYKLNPSSILHGQVTIAETGGWSWCPSSLYHMPVEIAGDLSSGEGLGFSSCLVDVNGVLTGSWHYRALEKEEVVLGRIVSSSLEMTVIMKTEDALRRWEYCLLLRENNRGGPGLGFLVIPVGRSGNEEKGEFIHCKFVGSVHDVSPKPSEGYDPRFKYDYFKIGMEGEKELLGSDFIEEEKPEGRPNDTFDWLRDKLWMGDSLMGELLVMRPGSKPRVTDAFALQVSEKESSNGAQHNPIPSMVLLSNPQVSLSPNPVFSVKTHRKTGPNTKSLALLERVPAELSWSWPPETIPAQDRTYYGSRPASSDPREYSTGLFRLRKEEPSVTFAEVNKTLFTPDIRRPYKGVWTGMLSSIA
jgi:hypothetical protein